MRVLYSFWGFITPLEKNTVVNTPDGERGNRVDFVNELLKRGHTPVQLQKMRDEEQYPGVEYDDSGFDEPHQKVACFCLRIFPFSESALLFARLAIRKPSGPDRASVIPKIVKKSHVFALGFFPS